ncbi:hypothetical protein ES708_10807 [subsurface metagenome]
MLAAIEDGGVDLDDTIDTGKGIFNYYDLTIRDDNYLSGGHGILTVQEVFELSSNVGMAFIVEGLLKFISSDAVVISSARKSLTCLLRIVI